MSRTSSRRAPSAPAHQPPPLQWAPGVVRCVRAARPTVVLLALPAAVLVCAAACAPGPPALPTGAGSPLPEISSAYQQASAGCAGTKTMTASMSLSGTAGSSSVRGRIDAGFAAPDRARLEGLAPFGKPVFVLVMSGGRGTLVIVRDDRVLRDAPAEQIVEALAGVPLDAAALRTVIAGCGLSTGTASEGRAFPGGWASARVGDSDVYLRQSGHVWSIAGASRGALTVTYAGAGSGRPPSTIRVRAEAGGRVTADLTVRVSEVDVNAALDPRTFDVDLPAHPIPLTLQELRRAGPLGEL